MQQPQLRPLGVGEILDVAIKLYLRHAPALLRLVAVVVIPVVLLGLILSLGTIPAGTGVRDGNIVLPQGAATGFIVASAIAQLLVLLATLLATGASLRAISDAYLGRAPDAGASLRFAAGKLPSLIWASILVVVLVILGFIAFIVPGIYLGVAFAVVVPALLFENLTAARSLGRSRDLVKGFWWKVFGTELIGIVIIPALVQFVISMVFGVILLTSVESAAGNVVVSAIGQLVGSLVTVPLQAAVLTVLYFDLRVRKEGFDLQLLARQIGAPPTGPIPAGASPPPPSGP